MAHPSDDNTAISRPFLSQQKFTVILPVTEIFGIDDLAIHLSRCCSWSWWSKLSFFSIRGNWSNPGKLNVSAILGRDCRASSTPQSVLQRLEVKLLDLWQRWWLSASLPVNKQSDTIFNSILDSGKCILKASRDLENVHSCGKVRNLIFSWKQRWKSLLECLDKGRKIH